MNVYAHSSEEAKLSSARLLDELDKEDGPESPKGEPEKKERGERGCYPPMQKRSRWKYRKSSESNQNPAKNRHFAPG